MVEIAEEAGVAVQTLYHSVGAKRAILFGLLEVIDHEGGVGSNRERIGRAVDPEEVLAAAVGLTRRLNERAGDIVAAVRSAAPSEPDLAAALAEGGRRHRAGAGTVAHRLAAIDGLRADVSVVDATQILTLLTATDSWLELTDSFGRTYDEAERWILKTLKTLLLKTGA